MYSPLSFLIGDKIIIIHKLKHLFVCNITTVYEMNVAPFILLLTIEAISPCLNQRQHNAWLELSLD